MNFYPAPDERNNENGPTVAFLVSLKKEPGDCIARMGERAAEGGILERIARPREPISLRASAPTRSCASRRRSRSLKACARCADDGSGHELEVQFSPFKGWILRYIWTFGQILSTAFMNRSR